MAVRTTKKKTIEETPVEEVTVETTTEQTEDTTVDIEPVVEIPEEKPTIEGNKAQVTVDTNTLKVDEEKIPEETPQNVKIRMRVDHKCVIAMERYDLKAGSVYNVPANVKRILNDAGLLAPL